MISSPSLIVTVSHLSFLRSAFIDISVDRSEVIYFRFAPRATGGESVLITTINHHLILGLRNSSPATSRQIYRAEHGLLHLSTVLPHPLPIRVWQRSKHRLLTPTILSRQTQQQNYIK